MLAYMPGMNSIKVTFTNDLFKAAKAARPDLSDAVAQLVTAHGAYESNWGSCIASRMGLNFWNLTAGSAWTGSIVMGADVEFKAGSADAKPIQQKFRRYPNAVIAVQNYFQFLSTPRYADALAKLLRGDETFIVDLGMFTFGPDGKTATPAWPSGAPKGGFYTLPIPRYWNEFKLHLDDVRTILSAA